MTPETYRAVVLEIKDRVYGYSVRLLGDAEEARDVAQEALVRLWEHRAKVPGEEHARAWTFRTAHNLAMDRLRGRTARPRVDEQVLGLMPSGEPDPERHALGREGLGQLEAALAGLGASDRAVILMRDVQGLSYAEMVDVLDAPVGTVKVRLHRARERLRKALRDAEVHP